MVRAVVLAGGRGRRLSPYTAVFPKPLVPLGDRPILEIVIGQLRRAGFDRLTLAVGHLAGLIEAYFGDGSRFGVRIEYALETEPLGTAGPLSMLSGIDEDFLVMNGDVLTDLDFGRLLDAHRESDAIATIGVYRKPVDVTLGVVEVDGGDQVTDYVEKPALHYLVSTGVYGFRPDVLRYLDRGVPCHIPDLILRLIGKGERVHAHRHEGYWLDIGRPEDYEVALDHLAHGRRF
jgi:NDP-sugar pyrophosphorylase family protein